MLRFCSACLCGAVPASASACMCAGHGRRPDERYSMARNKASSRLTARCSLLPCGASFHRGEASLLRPAVCHATPRHVRESLMVHTYCAMRAQYIGNQSPVFPYGFVPEPHVWQHLCACRVRYIFRRPKVFSTRLDSANADFWLWQGRGGQSAATRPAPSW